MRRLIATAIVVGALLTPVLTQAISVNDLQQQIGALLTQLAQLQEQIKSLDTSAGSSTTPSAGPVLANTTCPLIVRQLARGSQGDDVTMLQNFLVSQGTLTTDSTTGYYGPLTEAAVQKWQAQNNIVSSGDAASNGYGAVGVRTRAAIRAACGLPGQGGDTLPSNDTLSVSVTGLAASADVTVNTKGSCVAQQYTLDFGDGTATHITSVAANTCHAIGDTAAHTYAASGRYTVRLTSGAEKISVPLSVMASAPQPTRVAPTCSIPLFATSSVPMAFIGVNWTLPVLSASTSDATVVTAGGLPSGVTLQDQIAVLASTGTAVHNWTLSGVPNFSGANTLTLSAKNSCGTAVRTISLPVNVLRGTQCSPVVAPTCSGSLTSLGNDSNGCSLGYQCTQDQFVHACPNYSLPLCANGTLVAQGIDSNGCQAAPLCVPGTSNLTFSASPISGAAPLTVTFSGAHQSEAINFGDGSGVACNNAGNYDPYQVTGQQAQVLWNCNVGTVSHSYQNPGTYVAKSGNSSVTITVGGLSCNYSAALGTQMAELEAVDACVANGGALNSCDSCGYIQHYPRRAI